MKEDPAHPPAPGMLWNEGFWQLRSLGAELSPQSHFGGTGSVTVPTGGAFLSPQGFFSPLDLCHGNVVLLGK